MSIVNISRKRLGGREYITLQTHPTKGTLVEDHLIELKNPNSLLPGIMDKVIKELNKNHKKNARTQNHRNVAAKPGSS